jgi:hypothetical protein
VAVRISEAKTNDAPAPQTKPDREVETTRGLFPSGSGALYKLQGGKQVALDHSELVTLVNVSLSQVHVRTVNDAIKNPKGFEERVVAVLPFGTLTLPVLHARRALATQEKPGGDPKLVVAPANGDCGGDFTFTGYGKPFRTCPYADCRSCGPLPERVKWSVWQVQHRISMLGTAPGISRVIETIDNRSPVMMWGLEVITRRAKAKQERLGFVGQVNPANVTF